MPALIVACVLFLFGVLGLVVWRMLDVAERVKLARVTAGGEELAAAVEDLGVRVARLEGYTTGADVTTARNSS